MERFIAAVSLQALYGHGEASILPGIIPIAPQDVLDLSLFMRG